MLSELPRTFFNTFNVYYSLLSDTEEINKLWSNVRIVWNR